MQSPFPRKTYEKNAEVYKILANSKRLEILNLVRVKELSVEELRKILRLSKANVSQHLALLRHARLVRVRRSGVNAYYVISDPRIVAPCKIFHTLRKERSLS